MKKIATINTTKEILDKYQLQANKNLGQNFLIASNIIDNIIKAADIKPQDLIIEIGVGIGSLTQQLCWLGNQVIAYEVDRRFMAVYQDYLGYDNLEIIYQDFLEEDLEAKVKVWQEKYQRIIVVANLPYYITTKIIERLILLNNHPDRLVMMVQDEVARKLVGSYRSPLTLALDYLGKREYLFKVNRSSFIPQPHVDSAVIMIDLERKMDRDLFQLIQAAFKQRRKTLNNNLRDYDGVKEAFLELGLEGSLRAEQLSIADFIQLKEILYHEG